MKKRLSVIGICLLLLFCMSGCSSIGGDVETRLRPPRATGDQEAIQTALDAYIHSEASKETSGGKGYVLQYPQTGEYRSAFVIRDLDGDGVNEALAFYRMENDGSTHINLLRYGAGAWASVDDIKGTSADIDRISVGDLDGDGKEELLCGWSIYNSRDHKLVVYSLANNSFAERYTDTYSHLVVCNMTSYDHQDIVLFRTTSADSTTTARLMTMQNDSFTERGAVFLDGQITEYGGYHTAKLAEGQNGVYQDCQKDATTMITELVLWDGTQLTAPFYNPTEKITSITARESGLPSMDIDGDGQIEWPRSSRLPGEEKTDTKDLTLWLTDWQRWNVSELSTMRCFSSIVSPKDGCYIKLQDAWVDHVTAKYNSETRELSLIEWDKGVAGKTVLRLQTVRLGQEQNRAIDESLSLFRQEGTTAYYLWYDQSSALGLNPDLISKTILFQSFS